LSEAARVELSLLGHTLTVRSAAAPEYLKSLAAYLEERVTAIRDGGVRDRETALILAGIDIADELFRARDDVSRRDGDVSARLGALVTLLEQATFRSAP
jgi:cell division protein ZapA (FtsZ GTPase activity inhibitor)